ncbi:MAG TPA: hypothetical protein VH877_15390 [Polyangia bacterium]|jgi:hypothetical protein|nr:hypothetical protein [Polyangia bacterium]
MPTRHTQNDGSTRFEGDKGKATLQRLRPGTVLLTYAGHLKADFFEPLRQEMDHELQLAQMQKKPLVLIADCWDLQGVDTTFRELWVDWIKGHREQVSHVVGLLRSKLVVMAANIMSLFIGGSLIKTYSDPREFEMAIARYAPDVGWRRPSAGLGQVAARG